MYFNNYINKKISTAPLAFFRVAFGVLMCLSIIRFWYNGWVEKLYIAPKFFFSFYGFEWIKPIGIYTYLLFIFCGLAAFFVAIGYKYRIAIISFFLSFTYIELMDKTTYLNHYYFVSLVSFLMIFLPANAIFSVDSFKRGIECSKIPKWTVDSIKFMLGIVYFYAGLAKLNSDWLRGQPFRTYLSHSYRKRSVVFYTVDIFQDNSECCFYFFNSPKIPIYL